MTKNREPPGETGRVGRSDDHAPKPRTTFNNELAFITTRIRYPYSGKIFETAEIFSK